MKILPSTHFRYLDILLALLPALFALNGAAQQLDPAFERTRLTLPIMSDNAVEQADGRLIVSVVPPALYNGQPVPSILRLNLDGTPDAAFGAHWLQAGGATRTLRALPNGKTLIVGESASIVESLGGLDLATCTGVIVLQTNGDLDRNYHFVGSGSPRCGAVQPDGKVLIGGDFTTFNNVTTRGLVRLLSNGQLDPTFLVMPAPAGFNGTISSVYVQPDGKIMVGGTFTAYGSTPIVHLARLLPDGSLDATFNAHLVTTDFFQNVALQPDGKLIICNIESQVGRVRRLLANGSVDNSFASSSAITFIALTQPVDHGVTIQADGGILVAGSFSGFNGQPSSGLIRLLPTGAPDPAATFGADFTGVPTGICTLQSGSALVCGSFTNFNSRPTGLFKVTSTGQVDPAFALLIGHQGEVLASLLLPNGKIMVGGSFSAINGVGAANLALLNTDGSVDVALTAAMPPLNGAVTALALGPQGKVYVGGSFYETANPTRRLLLRVNPDGTQDNTYQTPAFTGLSYSQSVSALATYPDGRLLVGGGFDGPFADLFRLTPQGTMDPSFSPSFGTYIPYVSAMALQRDERIAVLTSNTSWQINPQGRVNGTSNSTSRYLHAIAVQPDGNILIGGEFSTFAGGSRNSIARLLPSGALDTSFDAGNIFMQNNIPAVKALAVQADGRILCAGYFTSIGGQPHRSIARLMANGQIDNSFADTAPVHPEVSFLSIHANGRLLVGASALDAQTNQPLTQGLTCLIVPSLTGPAPIGPLKTSTSALPVEVSLFPTPATGVVMVRAQATATWLEVTVYDIFGRKVRQATAFTNQLELSVANWAAATYMVRIVSNNGTSYKKLIVQH